LRQGTGGARSFLALLLLLSASQEVVRDPPYRVRGPAYRTRELTYRIRHSASGPAEGALIT
jgi:hypothetical protein